MVILHFLLHVTGGDNGSGPFYLEWSGFVSLLLACGFVVTWWRNSRCHVETCHKRGKYPFQHYKLCKDHHPKVPIAGITHHHIMKLHKRAEDESYER